jgi:hypothetical protein
MNKYHNNEISGDFDEDEVVRKSKNLVVRITNIEKSPLLGRSTTLLPDTEINASRQGSVEITAGAVNNSTPTLNNRFKKSEKTFTSLEKGII